MGNKVSALLKTFKFGEKHSKNIDERIGHVHMDIDEAHQLMKQDVGGLLLPVDDSDRMVEVIKVDSGDSTNVMIRANRPSDIQASGAFKVWGDRRLTHLVLHTDCHGGHYGEPHRATVREWTGLLSRIVQESPVLSSPGYLVIQHQSGTLTPLLKTLPTALTPLIQNGVRYVNVVQCKISASAVLGLVLTLKEQEWVMRKGGLGVHVQKLNGEAGLTLQFYDVTITGPDAVLANVKRVNTDINLCYQPTWKVGDEEPPEPDDPEKPVKPKPKPEDPLVLLYKEACDSGTVSICRSRLVVLGPEGSGKTSLIRSLMGEPVVQIRQETNLVDLHYTQLIDNSDELLTIPDGNRDENEVSQLIGVAMKAIEAKEPTSSQTLKPNVKTRIRAYQKSGRKGAIPTDVLNVYKEPYRKSNSLTIWDMGGENIYYGVQELFLSSAALYFLVLDASLDLDEDLLKFRTEKHDQHLPTSQKAGTQRDYLRNILSSISLRMSEVKNIPKVFIICTKCDLLSPESVNQFKASVTDYTDDLREHDLTKCNIEGIYTYSSISPRSHLTTIKSLIGEHLYTDPFTKRVPIKWLLLRNELKKKRIRNQKEIREIAANVNIRSSEEVRKALEYFHSLGELFYCDSVLLKDQVICDLPWIIDNLRKIVTIPLYQDRGLSDQSNLHWLQLSVKGILHQDIIEKSWQDDRFIFSDMMQKLFIIHPVSNDILTNQVRFLVPAFLKHNSHISHKDGLHGPPPLYIQLKHSFLPVGFTSAVFVGLAQKMEDKCWKDKIFANTAEFVLVKGLPTVSMRVSESKTSDGDQGELMLKLTTVLSKSYSQMTDKEKKKVGRALGEGLKKIQVTVSECLKLRNIQPVQRLYMRCKCRVHHLAEICQEGWLENTVTCEKHLVREFSTTSYEPWFNVKDTKVPSSDNVQPTIESDSDQEPVDDHVQSKQLVSPQLFPDLATSIHISPNLLNHLSKGVVGHFQKDYLLNDYVEQTLRVGMLLKLVEGAGGQAYHQFITALRAEKMAKAVNILQPEPKYTFKKKSRPVIREIPNLNYGRSYSPPQLTYHESLNQPVVLRVGESMTIEVDIEGWPLPEVKWNYNEEILHTDRNITVTTTEEKTVLHITNSNIHHQGNYSLRAENTRGFFHAFFKVCVFDEPPRSLVLGRPAPDFFGATLFSDKEITLQHPSSDITLHIPEGAIPKNIKEQVQGSIDIDLNGYTHLLRKEEYLIAPVVDYKVTTIKKFLKPVTIKIPHRILDEKVRQNIKVYAIPEGSKRKKQLGRNVNAESFITVKDNFIEITTSHFTKFPCVSHGTECEVDAIMRLYMVETLGARDVSVKIAPMLLLGCSTLREFKGNVFLDRGMFDKAQKLFHLTEPHDCVSVTTHIVASESWKFLNRERYMDTSPTKVKDVEEMLTEAKVPKVIRLDDYVMSNASKEKLSCTFVARFKYKDGSEKEEEIQFVHNFDRRGRNDLQSVSSSLDLEDEILDEHPLCSHLSKIQTRLMYAMSADVHFLATLEEHGVINHFARERLQATSPNHECVGRLIAHIKKDVKRRLNPLIDSLIETNQESVADVIREGLKLDHHGKVIIEDQDEDDKEAREDSASGSAATASPVASTSGACYEQGRKLSLKRKRISSDDEQEALGPRQSKRKP